VQGELFVLFKFWIDGLCSLLEHVLSRMCRAIAFAQGVRDFFFI
jgi:hypothetical protein